MLKGKALQKAGRPEIEDKLKHKTVSFSASPDLIKTINDYSKQLFGGNRTKYIVHKLSQKASVSNNKGKLEVDRIELYKLIKEVNKIGDSVSHISGRLDHYSGNDHNLEKVLSDTQIKLDELITLMNTILQKNNPNFR